MTTTLTVKALYADGTCYRWWLAERVYASDLGIVTETPASNAIWDIKGPWASRNHIRSFYWFDRPYNLLEVYETDGTLAELYIHIASAAHLDGDSLQYTDHELDVVMVAGSAPFIADEDDFQRAIGVYNYTSAFQESCRQACDDALDLISRWPSGAAPDVGLAVAKHRS